MSGGIEMTINKEKNGNTMMIALEGRLDTVTAPQLEEELKASIDGVADLTFDFAKLVTINISIVPVLR